MEEFITMNNLYFTAMDGSDLKEKRKVAGIPGRLVCTRVGMDRGKLSDIERGYIEVSAEELALLNEALDRLIEAKSKVMKVAEEVGWPMS